MYPTNWTLIDLLNELRAEELRVSLQHARPAPDTAPEHGPSLRAALAALLVRAGLRLDASAAERLRAPQLAGKGPRQA